MTSAAHTNPETGFRINNGGLRTVLSMPYDSEERTFDAEINRGNLDVAERLIKELVKDSIGKVKEGFYPTDLIRLMTKEQAMPFYERALFEQSGQQNPVNPDQLYDVYTNTAELLRYFKAWYDLALPIAPPGDRFTAELKGALTKLTAFSLTARSVQGTDEDPFTILPMTYARDPEHFIAGTNRMPKKKPHADFKIIDRESSQSIQARVRTTSKSLVPLRLRPGPDADIAAIDLVHVVGTEYPTARHQLQSAMIAEANDTASNKQIRTVEHAEARLHSIYFEQLSKLALENTGS